MQLELPTPWVIALNVVGWPVIQLGVAFIFTRLPARLFSASPAWAQPGRLEARVESALLGVRLWKHLLPDAAPWMRGIAKRKLASLDPVYLHSFATETRRGEAAHWVMLLAAPIFFLWNPAWADWVMVGYAVAANLPCIIVQRYNRYRLCRLLPLLQMHRELNPRRQLRSRRSPA